jgi:uncharacterized protein (DUF2141 family)
MKARSVLAQLGGAFLLALAGPAAAEECAGTPSAVKLAVQVVNLRDGKGQVAVTVYPDDPRRFLAKKGKLARVRAPTVRPHTRVCFWLPSPGVYAVAAYHDADGDSDFDRSPLGAPTEGFGFSNDAPTRFSLPAFEDTRVRVKAGDNLIRVRMRYP